MAKEFKLGIPAGVVAPGNTAFAYGVSDAFAPLPICSLINTATASMSGFQASNNLGQFKDVYIRTLSKKELLELSTFTPSLPNRPLYNLSDYIGTNCNVLSTQTNGSYDGVQPRGTYVIDSMVVTHNISGGGSDNSTISTNINDSWSIAIVATLYEPIGYALSPFLFPQQDDGAGSLFGQDSCSITFNWNDGKNIWSSSTGYISSLTVTSISNTVLYYKTIQPNVIEASKIPTKIVYPCKQIESRLTTLGSTAPANSTGNIAYIQSFNFNSVPNKIYLAVRKQRSLTNWNDSDSFLPITNLSLTLGGGTSALLAAASQRQLWQMTCENMPQNPPSWQEFSGKINTVGAAGVGYANVVPTCASPVCIRPAFNLCLTEELTESSQGSIQFGATITFSNPTSSGVQYECIVMWETDGLIEVTKKKMVLVQGISNVGLVLKVKEEEDSVSSQQIREQLSGGRLKGFHAFAKLVKKHMHHKREREMEGSAMSAGAMSAGAMSAGRMQQRGHSKIRHLLAC